jgi:hypothetical protein
MATVRWLVPNKALSVDLVVNGVKHACVYFRRDLCETEPFLVLVAQLYDIMKGSSFARVTQDGFRRKLAKLFSTQYVLLKASSPATALLQQHRLITRNTAHAAVEVGHGFAALTRSKHSKYIAPSNASLRADRGFVGLLLRHGNLRPCR